MTVRLPPLSTLRVFRAAAHHLSFTAAANDLNVTQAAVSHQIKSLESHFGRTLFERGGRTLALTEYGRRLLPYVDRAFSILQEGVEHVHAEADPNALTVSVLPSFAARWLVPRLGLFLRAHPEVDFRLAPSRHLTDFRRERVDLAVRYGTGSYRGLVSLHLEDEIIVPVCAPALLEGPHPIREPSDLRHHVLLHDEGHGDWRQWLLAAEAQDVDPARGPVYTDSGMAIQSAIAGDGIVLAREKLVKSDLERGLLVRPFDIPQPTRFAYYIVYPDDLPVTPAMEAFIEWVRAEMLNDTPARPVEPA